MKTIHAYNIGILEDYDATETTLKINKKEISREEVVACAIERANFVNPTINAIVTSDFERALVNANKKYSENGVFAGVPTFIKDLNDYEGLPTLMGSSGTPSVPKKKNDPVVEQILKVTDSIVLGKSSSSEYGLLPCGETLQQGDTRNPWNLGHSTGGSSAGSSALVAAGVVPFAHANDGGGSIRIPASCCGLVGLKPSRGRNISSQSAMAPIDMAVDGIVCRSVRDAANYFYGLEQFYTNPNLPKIGKIEHPDKKRLKIAVFTKSTTDVESHGDVVDATMNAAKLCESLGHQIEFIDNPISYQFNKDFLLYWSFLSFGSILMEFQKYGLKFNPLKATKFTKDLAKAYPFLSIPSVFSIKRLKQYNELYSQLFNKYDVLLSPTLSHPAPPIGHFGPNVDTLEVIFRLNSYVNFTTLQNITGAPAISLPMGMSKDKLPIGIQFAGNVGEEAKLLSLAFELERVNKFLKINEF